MSESQQMFVWCGIALLTVGIITDQKAVFVVGTCMAIFGAIQAVTDRLWK